MKKEHPIWQAIDHGGGQTCDVPGVLRELKRAGYVIAPLEANIATKWNPKKLANYDVRRFVPAHVLEVINTPHEHESADHNKPVWIIWLHKIDFPPVIDTLCDTPDSAVYHYGALVEGFQNSANKANLSAHVERVPMNHRFASSLNDVFADKTFTSMRERTVRNAFRYPRTGD